MTGSIRTMSGRIPALALGFGLLAATCGGSAGSSSSGADGASVQDTVSVRQVPGAGRIYTDASGEALYSPAQEASGKIMCTGSCTSIWIPCQPQRAVRRPKPQEFKAPLA